MCVVCVAVVGVVVASGPILPIEAGNLPLSTETSISQRDSVASGRLVENAMPQASTTALVSDAVSECKIQETSKTRGATWAGFPDRTPLTARTGVVKWALIPLDFADLKGEKNFRPRINKQMKLLSDWYFTVSHGKLKVEWVVADNWVRVPGKTSDYIISQSANLGDVPNGQKLFKAAMDSADSVFDFTDVKTVNFILPKGQTFMKESSQGFPWDQAVRDYRTQEGTISSYSIAGEFFDLPGKTYWSYWAHEFGHAIGLPHVSAQRGELPKGSFNPWDLMGGQDGPSRELSGWLRFLAGWMPDSQVYCKKASDFNDLKLTIEPLSGPGKGLKLAILPVSTTKAVLIESRRETKFSCKTKPGRNGVLVYVYDSTLGHGEEFLKPVSPRGRAPQSDSCSSRNFRSAPPNPDFLLRAGDKVSVEGIQVKVVAHGKVDRVKVSKK
jgi:M6 family metalloprotease-like protein